MECFHWEGKKVVVLGLGASGKSAASFLLQRGARVVGVDCSIEMLLADAALYSLRAQGMAIVRGSDRELAARTCDYMVLSPGVSSKHPLVQEAKKVGVPVIGEVELALKTLPIEVVGITGTNGKTTVCYLIEHVLKAAKKKCRVLGNAGTPLSSLSSCDPEEVIICELSSYQLETLSEKKLKAAAILNITPDHLDRYPSFTEYAAAKTRIGRCLSSGGKFFVGEKVFKEQESFLHPFHPERFGFGAGNSIRCDGRQLFVKEKVAFLLPEVYRGTSCHNVENIMAAFAICDTLGVEAPLFQEALESFVKPPHRIEFVRMFRGVKFYNDSKATNSDAAIQAVRSMAGQVVLIAGGVAKGLSFLPWIPAFQGKVKAIIAVGESSCQIEQELGRHFPTVLSSSLANAVDHALKVAEDGDHVLLAPGCASFDMFKNYEDRGNQFKQIVFSLKE